VISRTADLENEKSPESAESYVMRTETRSRPALERLMKSEASDSAVGQSAPALCLPRPDGGELSLEDCLGRATLVVFLSHAA
jgi:hypothetical protein